VVVAVVLVVAVVAVKMPDVSAPVPGPPAVTAVVPVVLPVVPTYPPVAVELSKSLVVLDWEPVPPQPMTIAATATQKRQTTYLRVVIFHSVSRRL
jgi:hypothetical protein